MVFQREFDFVFIRYMGRTDSRDANARVIRISNSVLIFLRIRARAIKTIFINKIMAVVLRWDPLRSSNRWCI